MGYTIVVAYLKGGTGKSTMALLLAFALTHLGFRVRVLDGDPSSQTAYDVARRVRAGGDQVPFEVDRHPFPDDIDERIQECRDEGVDFIIVDAGGDSETFVRKAVTKANLVVCPVLPEPWSVIRLSGTLEPVQQSAPDCPLIVVFNRVNGKRVASRDWRSQLEAEEVPVADTELRDRTCYQRITPLPKPRELEEPLELVAELEVVEAAKAGVAA